jgi:amidase
MKLSGSHIIRWGRIGALTIATAVLLQPTQADETVSFELETATMDDVQKAMDAGALTSVELAILYLNRIETYDKNGIKLNTVPAINPRLIPEASRADRMRANGEKLGPLQGIPFTAKGSFNFAGLPNNDGLTVWADLFPKETCFVIKTLQEKGAVFFGHANLDAFQASTSQANSQVWGLALNPYNPATRTGGSSGGSGASTGGNMCFFSLGGETGGSVRSPSERGGIVGIKTSNALISVHGLAPLAWDRDVVGPMARYAKDTAYIMDAAVVADPEDIWASVDVIPGRTRDSGYAEKVESATLTGKRLGVPLNMLGAGTDAVSVQIRDLFTQARADLIAAGAEIVEVTIPPELDITFAGRRASVPGEVVTPPTRKLYSPVTSDLTGNMVGSARGYPFKTFLEAILTEPADTPDTLHAKVVARISPVTQLTQASRDAIANKTTFGPTAPDSVEHFLAVRYQILDYEAFLAANNLDALILPTAPTKTATSISLPPLSRALVNSFANPFVTVPMGTVTLSVTVGGVPTDSIEPTTLGFMGRFWGDSEVLALAAAYEEATKHRVNSALVPPLAGENFEYVIEEIVPEVKAPNRPPVIQAPGSIRIEGKGRSARLILEGRVLKTGALKSLTVSVAGKQVPVGGQKEWTSPGKKGANFKAVINIKDLLKRIPLDSPRVNVSILAKDENGNAGALVRRMGLPKLDDYK